MKSLKLQSGYSIIEIIIYIAVFAVVTIVVINAFLVLVSFFSQTRTNHSLLQNGNSALAIISKEIHASKSVRDGTSTFGTSPGVLDLDSIDENNNTQIIKFSVSNGALNLSKDGTVVDTVLSPNVKVTTLIFRKTTTDKGVAIKTEMSLQDSKDKNAIIETFYNVTNVAK